METTNEVVRQAVTTQEGTWIETSLVEVPDYVRKVMPEGLDSLGTDMEKNGQLQNIVLVKKADGRYECIIGNRRLAAAKKRGWQKIRADVKEGLSEANTLAMVVSENLEREDACPFYTGMLYDRMMKAGEVTTLDELASKVGKDKSSISRYLSLAKVPQEVWQDHQNQLMSMRACLEIAKAEDLDHQKKLVEACAKEGLTGATVKKRALALKNGEPKGKESRTAGVEAPQAPFTFQWKGNGLLIKGRLFTPHTENIAQYANELQEAGERFLEEERSRMKPAA